MRTVGVLLRSRSLGVSAAAAGAEQDDQGDDNDPGAVVVKKVAKAVIHQKVLRKNSLRGISPYAIIVWRLSQNVTGINGFFSA